MRPRRRGAVATATAGSRCAADPLRLASALAVVMPFAAFAVLWPRSTSCATSDANRAPGRRRRHRRRRRRRLLPVLGDEQASSTCCPSRSREGVRPYVFVGPALVILERLPRLPGDQHDHHQLQGRARSEEFVGLDNYGFVFTDESMLRSIRNTRGCGSCWCPLVAVTHRAGLRHARRPAPPGRGGREVDDLPADGDLVRRRGRRRGGSSTASGRRASAPTSAC